MKKEKESRTFLMDLEDSLGFETIEDMLKESHRMMLSDGWYLKSFETLGDGEMWRCTYEKGYL